MWPSIDAGPDHAQRVATRDVQYVDERGGPTEDQIDAALGVIDAALHDAGPHMDGRGDGGDPVNDAAGDWALGQLPQEHRPVLERARDLYRSGGSGSWEDMDAVQALAALVVAQIGGLAGRA